MNPVRLNPLGGASLSGAEPKAIHWHPGPCSAPASIHIHARADLLREEGGVVVKGDGTQVGLDATSIYYFVSCNVPTRRHRRRCGCRRDLSLDVGLMDRICM